MRALPRSLIEQIERLVEQIERLVEQKLYLSKADFARSVLRESLLPSPSAAERAPESE